MTDRKDMEEGTFEAELDWEDISHSGQLKPEVSITLNMASGGDHAWNYVLVWEENTPEDQPLVYVEKYPIRSRELQKDKTVIVRYTNGCNRSEEIALVDVGDDLPEDSDSYEYCRFTKPE